MKLANRLWTRVAACSALTAAFVTSTPVLADDLPEGREVLQKYIEATGGREAYEDIETIQVVGTFSMPAMGIEADLKVFQQVPDKMLVLVDIPGMGQIQRGINGDLAWESSAMMGTREMEETERNEFVRDANPAAILDGETFETFDVEGKEEVNGEEAFKVNVKMRNAEKPYTAFYSVDSGLLLRTVSTQTSPMGEIEAVSNFSEYREVGEKGLKQPHQIVVQTMGSEQILKMETINVNGDIEASRFDPPAELRNNN